MKNPFNPENYRSYKNNDKQEETGKKEEKNNEVDVNSLNLSQLQKTEEKEIKKEIKTSHFMITGAVFLFMFYFLSRVGVALTQLGNQYKVEVSNGPGLFVYLLKNNFFMFLLFLFASVVVAFLVFNKLTTPKEKEDDRAMRIAKISVFGETNWMDNAEIARRLVVSPMECPEGMPIGVREGSVIGIPWKNDLPNSNVLIVGPPGTRKSIGHVLPGCAQLMRKGHSIIVTDTKGDLYRKLAPIAQYYGYKIKKFICQAERFRYSDGWDALKIVKESNDPLSAASILADVVITNTEDPKGNSPLFWRNLDGNLLEALVLYVALSPHFIPMTERDEPKRDMKEVYSLLSSSFEVVEQIFENIKLIDNKDLCLAAYERWHTNAQAEQGFSNLATRLRILQNDFITGMLSSDDIDIKEAGKEKCIYFVILDDQVGTYNFISSLFFSFAFYELVKLADDGDQVLEVPVHFMLDEFANCGTIPDFTRKISTVRSRGIAITMIIQGLNQLKLLYPNGEWENIINACAVQVVLGAYENTTAKYYSDRIGDCTVEVESQSRDFATFSLSRLLGVSRDVKITKTTQRRRLLNPEEISGMDVDRQIVIIAGTTKVLEENKYNFYTMHPDAKITADIKHTEGTPQWVIDNNLLDIQEKENVYVDRETGELFEPNELGEMNSSGLGGILSQAKKKQEDDEYDSFELSGLNDYENDDHIEEYDDTNDRVNENYLLDEITDDFSDDTGLL